MSSQAQSTRQMDRPMADPRTATQEMPNQQTQTMPGRPDMERQEMAPGMRQMERSIAPMRGNETKSAVKSTEFYIYLLAVGGVLLASQLVGRNAAGTDVFRADKAWWYIALLTIGYLVSRGLAKAGSSIWRRSER